jgi:rhodanese-related sulfurtransferase
VYIAPETSNERLAEGALYLDVRSPEEFEEGHPPGAWNLPLQLRAKAGGLADNPRFAELAAAVLDPAREIIVGCRSGPRAERAAALLAPRVVWVMNGGMEGRRDAFGALLVPGWKQAGLPVAYDGTTYAELQRRVPLR